MRIAVIGAGIAGVACARRLVAGGQTVRVFDKGRGLGGRMATRRAPGTAFDHGAQYFTVRDDGFARQVSHLMRAGAVAEWQARFALAEGTGDRISAEAVSNPRYVATPHMTSLCHALAEGLDIVPQCQVEAIAPDAQGWWLDTGSSGTAGPFDTVLITIPAAQAAALIEAVAPRWATAVSACAYAPCLAAMVEYAAPLDLGLDAVRWRGDEGTLSWVARNNSKPGRPDQPEAWVLHGSPGWSAENLDKPAIESAELLCASFAETFGIKVSAQRIDGHGWRYAQVTQPLAAANLYDPQAALGLAGDWCRGARVEDAWRSGDNLAGRVLAAVDC